MNNLDVQKAKEVLKNNGDLDIYWHKQDIINVAEDNDIELSAEQIDNIAIAIENRESDYDLSYETFEQAIENELKIIL